MDDVEYASERIQSRAGEMAQAIRSAGCSSIGPRIHLGEHTHGGSQLSVTPMPGDPTLSHMHAGKTSTYTK